MKKSRDSSRCLGAVEVSGKLEEEVLHGGELEDLEAVVDALQGQDEQGVGEEARI